MSRLMERLKKNKGINAQQMQKQLEQNGQARGKDDRLWKYAFDEKKKIAYAKIRFLPIPDCDLERQENGEIPEDAVLSPMVCVRRHNFKGPTGRFYSAISRQTWGEDCPVREHDRVLWDKQKKTEDNTLKETLKDRIPGTNFYANILVEDDRANPENNGKVFLFKFGKAIKNLIDAAPNPKFDSDPKVDDPFCAFEGASLVIELEGEERSFKSWTGLVPKDFGRCKWVDKGPLAGGDEAKMEEIIGQCHSLYDFVDHKLMEPFEVQERRFKDVMGISADAALSEEADAADNEESQPQANNAAALANQQLQEAEEERNQQMSSNKPDDKKPTGDSAGSEDLDDFLDSL